MSENNSDRASWHVRWLRDGRLEFSGTFNPEDFDHYYGLPLITSSRSDRTLIAVPEYIPSGFYRNLIREINYAYSYQLYTSTYICLRKLFENLIIELLRTNFGTAELELYYREDRNRFQDFSVLLQNLSDKTPDFSQYTGGFDQRFFQFLLDFRERANSNAHTIDIINDPQYFEDNKERINDYFTLLCDVLRRISAVQV